MAKKKSKKKKSAAKKPAKKKANAKKVTKKASKTKTEKKATKKKTKQSGKASASSAASKSKSKAGKYSFQKFLKADDPTLEQLTKVLRHNKKNFDCLKASLQYAVTLEFATIPPYLCALWSIKDDLHPAAKSIREVVQEEMLHMALACNMLASIGGQPRINTKVPVYPGPLPGNVHPGLIAKLSGLTKASLKDFLWIERPVKVIPRKHAYVDPESHKTLETTKQADQEHDETIGEFYEAIKAAFYEIEPDMSPDKQISGPLAWAVIRKLEDMERAINWITEQGEGSGLSPEDTDGDLSHFYRFLEVHEEVHLIWDKDKEEFSDGKPLPFPDVWNMAVVPKGGYKERHLKKLSKKVQKDVRYNLAEFDKTYTRLLDQLQGAWKLGGQESLIRAYETMFELEKYAKPLMQTKIPGGKGATFGPCFRYDDEVGTR